MRLIDADALDSKIESHYKHKKIDRYDHDLLGHYIDEEMAPTIGGWISVKDRLPDRGADILAFMRNGAETRIVACNYGDNVWYDCVMNCIVAGQNVTHWMSLPEPPKENDHETD